MLGSVVLNEAVWQSWIDIGRVMVPAVVFAWILWVPRARVAPPRRGNGPSGAGERQGGLPFPNPAP